MKTKAAIVTRNRHHLTTMTRGNWQRRVELNEARRNEAKQKKQRNEEKKIWKTKAQALLAMLDRNASSLLHRRKGKAASAVIHIYTDTLPSDAPPVLDLWEEEADNQGKHGQRRRRARSISIENEKAVTTATRPTNSGGKKKAHPRSKESKTDSLGEVDAAAEAVATPKLCRSFFFGGKCEHNSGGGGGGSKKAGKRSECRHVHYPNRYKSLAAVVSPSTANDGGASLSLSEAAYFDDLTGTGEDVSTVESLDMVYYFSLNLADLQEEDLSKNEKPPSDWIAEALAKRSCSLGSLVYLVLDNQLLYDRYREGVVVEDGDLSDPNDTHHHVTANSSTYHEKVNLMPGSVLEYVLTFLEDPAVASMGSVCKAWNHEIGKHSINLWKHLLERRSWPIPVSIQNSVGNGGDDDTMDTKEQGQRLRGTFISHYTAVRNVKAIKSGVEGLLSSRKMADFREGCTRSFEALKGSPQAGNHCVALKVFSQNRVLAAYYQDCSLRLFDSADKISGSGGGRLCREIVCYNIDPYRKTRKRGCKLVAMALDEQCVGCLLHVVDENSEGEASILAVVGREALLIADDSIENDATQVIDISQSVLNYLVSCEEADHGMLQFLDYASDGGNLDDVEVLVSQSIVACGYGRFMVEVSVSVPLGDATDDDDSDARMTLLFRKLFLISASVGAIIWMCDSNSTSRPPRPRHDEMTLASATLEENGRWGCNIISVSARAPGIMSGSIDPSGTFVDPLLLQNSDSLQEVHVQDGWSLRVARQRPVVVFDHTVVVADNLVRESDEEQAKYKSLLSFYSIDQGHEIPDVNSLALDDNIAVCKLARLGDHHILVIGRETVDAVVVTELDEVGGHWFGGAVGNADATVNQLTINVVAVIVDVESRSEIYRSTLVDDVRSLLEDDETPSEGDIPIQIVAFGGTVAAGAWWKGVVITGADARPDPTVMDLDASETATPKSAKKKKKGAKKGGKKDGFARGMSMRG